MAIERSPYEGKFDEKLGGYNCMGKIVSVDPVARTCRVKTIGVKGRTDDLDLHNVQWISLTASATGEGDEDTALPRPGQYGVITFINNEPYIMGYYRPIKTPAEEGQKADIQDPDSVETQNLTTGDRLIRTVAGNRIILRSGGTVEIQSTGQCRTYWISSRQVINNVCNSYELEVSGGFMYWSLDPDTNKTTLQYYVYDALEPNYVLDLQIGSTATDGKFITAQMGAINRADSTLITPSFDLSVGNNGTTELTVGAAKQMNLKIDALTGNVDLSTKGSITQTVLGSVTQSVTGDVTQKVSGNVGQDVTGNATGTVGGSLSATIQGDTTITSQGSVTVDSKAQVDIKGASGINLMGDGASAPYQVLVNPLALSDFTGAPIQTPSSTVKASG